MNEASDLKDHLLGEERKSLSWMLEQAAAWKPQDYGEQISNRVNYIDGDMEEDLKTQLEAEFPASWGDMARHYTMLPIVQHLATKRAQTFRGRGLRFYLKNRKDGWEASSDKSSKHYAPEAEAFEEMIRLAQLPIVLRQIDTYLEETVAVAAKCWWDEDHVRVSAFTPDLVDVAINPERYWDPHSAYGILFQMPPADGMKSLEPRYEVWASTKVDPSTSLPIEDKLDPSGRKLFYQNRTWVTDGKEVWVGPDGDENKLRHWRDEQRPICPMTWFSLDQNQVYKLGSNSRIRFNQTINMGLTYLQFNMSWAMLGIPVYERQIGKGGGTESELPKQRLLSPKHALTLPPDVKFSFVRNEIPLERFTSTYEMFIQYNALLHHLAPRSMSPEGLPQSGTALRIEMANLSTYRDEKVETIRPQVVDLLCRMVVVRNAFIAWAKKAKLNETVIDLETWVPVFEPGMMNEGPVDYLELGTRFEAAIAANVATAADWAAEFHGITLEEAEKKVELNIQTNRDRQRETGLGAGGPERIFGPALEGEEGEEGDEKKTPPKGVTPPQLQATASAAAAAAGKAPPPPAAPVDDQVDDDEQVEKKPDESKAEPPSSSSTEPEKKPEPSAEPKAEPVPAPEPEDQGPLKGEMAKLNAYQLRQLIELDVVSIVDVRMQLTGETEEEARASILKAQKDNLLAAKAQAQKDEVLGKSSSAARTPANAGEE